MLTVIKIICTIYVLLLIFLYCFQRNLLYFPDKTNPSVPAGFDSLTVRTQDGLDLNAAFSAPKNKGYPVILFFHGNGGHFAHRTFKVSELIQQGYGVVLAEYRGYGGNKGFPSEQGLYEDGRTYMRFLQNNKYKVFLYGESLGTGVAIQMGLEYSESVMGIILETPYTSITDVAQEKYYYVPVRLLLKDRYQSIDKIDQLAMPKLFLHGKNDLIIPYENGKRLFEYAKDPKEFVSFENGGHNNLSDFDSAKYVLEFVRRVNNVNFKATRTEGESDAMP